MNITLSRDVEKRIEDLVQRGAYPSADALVHEALDSFLDIESEEDLEAVRRRITRSEGEIDRGEFEEYDAERTDDLARRVHARGQNKLANFRNANPNK